MRIVFCLSVLFILSLSVLGEKILGRSEVIPSDTCGVSVVSYEDERLYIFSLSEDSVVWYKSQKLEGGWSTWKLLADKRRMSSGPKPIRHSNGTLQVFARGADRRYYVSTLVGEQWTDWQSPFGNHTFSSPPVPVLTAAGSCLVFGISDETHSVWYSESGVTYSEISKFSPWADLGGNATSAPTIMVDAEALLHVFIRGSNRALWHLGEVYSYPGPKKWASWECLGGVLASSPKIPITLNSANLVEVYARAADKALWHRSQKAEQEGSSVTWGPWHSLGGVLASGAGVVVGDDGMASIFARATDKALYFKGQYEDSNGESQFDRWTTLGGMFSTTPTVVARADGLIDIFARGVDAGIWHAHQVEVNGTRVFSSWHSLGGHTRKFTC
eukprot:c18401_g1_i2.p1 GENE.c18401_g1_i2~~c18401_g1_i2.p1  ORF type:complete len:386 (-),score=181.81 c18401_g1_i2:106-1263(-)